MIPLLGAAAGVALKIALPLILPPIMRKLEGVFPSRGQGPQRQEAITRALTAFGTSLANDGVIQREEIHDLIDHSATVIKAFVPTMNAEREESTLGDGVRIERRARKVIIELEKS